MVKIFTVIALLAVASCGKNDKNSSNVKPDKNPPPLILPNEGNYRSVLRPLNKIIKDNDVYGTGIINIKDDTFSVQLHLIRIPKSTKYIQSIHVNETCPAEISDENKDSYIDIQEGMTSFGEVLIPLDGDVSAQTPGNDFFPRANRAGDYSYVQETLLSKLLEDLHANDDDLTDYVTKLNADESLNMEKRTLVVSAVQQIRNVPESVSLLEDQSTEAFIPIACGEIVRIKSEE